MLTISPEKIAEVRDRIDIERVVGRSVRLSKKGKRLTGLCPFHGEKTASFGVDATKKLWHCFGCQSGGDVFSFVMRIEGISFPEAVLMLAREVNVIIEDQKADPRETEERRHKERLYALNATAASCYERALQENKTAHTYLKEERGLEEPTIEKFQLGWAPEGWSHLTDHLALKKIDPKLGVVVGLLGTSARDGRIYDRLRGRVIFPIAIPGGDIAGFGARRADWIEGKDGKEGPKYLNSPESPIYDKSSIFYGLFHAKDEIRKSRRAVLVEGYLDVIGLHQAGVPQAIAACGTALSSRHASVLRRLTEEVVTMYDGDLAGQEATRKAAETLLHEGIQVRIVVLPEGEDPDTFARKMGNDAVDALINGAPSAIDYFVNLAKNTYKGGGIAGIAKAVESVKPLLLAVRDPLERDVCIDAAARTLDLEPIVLRRHLSGHQHQQNNKGLTGQPNATRSNPNAQNVATPAKKIAPPPAVEMAILKMFLESPTEVMNELEAKDALQAFSNPAIQAAMDAGVDAVRRGMPFDAPRALEAATDRGGADEATLGTLRRTLMETLPEKDDVAVCVKRLLRSRNDITLQQLRQRLAKETDPDAAAQLAAEADRLNRIMASLI